MVLRNRFIRSSLFCGVAMLTFGANAAHAQDGQTPPPEAPADEVAQDEAANEGEIVVRAQRREERLQDVPIAITTLNSDQLTTSGVADTETLRVAVPSLNVTTAVGGFGLPRIRGVGATGQGPGIENPVAIYVDGVYYGASFGILQSLYDVDQLTVLKGPQGTLFGRNATGGLIQIQTRNPSLTEVQANGQIGYGNYNTASAAIFASAPIARNAAFSISAQYEDRADGIGRNLFLNQDVQAGDTYAARAKLLIEPGPQTEVIFSIDANGRNYSDPAFVTFGLNTNGQNTRAQVAALGGNPDYDILADRAPTVSTEQWGASMSVEQGIGEHTLTSITAYRESRISNFFDPDGTTVQTLVINNNQYDKQFSQELSLISPNSGAFRYVLGLYYLHNLAGLDPNRTTGIAIFGNNGRSDVFADVTLDSYSAFAEGTYSIGENTNVTAGIRYTIDNRRFSGFTQTFNGATNATVTSPTTEDEVTFESPSWRLSVDHRFSPELLVYASYNRGFRAGTFVPQVTPFTILQPEEVDAFEVGFKSDLFDRRVRVNVAGYYFDQSSVQVFQIIAGVQNVYNAQGAEIYGVDGDITFNVSRNFRIFGGFNYNHARYKEFTDAVITVPFPVGPTFSTTQFTYVDSATGQTVANTTCLGTFVPPNLTTQAQRDAFYRGRLGGNCLVRGDASGNRLQNTPDITFSVGASLDIPTSIGKFTLAGHFYHNGGFVGSPDERVQQEAYSLLDASLTWAIPGDKFHVRLWGKNLTDSVYFSQISASNSGDNAYAGLPLTYGVQVGFRF